MKEHVPLGLVGVAACDQGLDQRDDLGKMLGDEGFEIRWAHAERLHVLLIGGDIALGDGADGHPRRRSGGVDLVVHVGEVARIDHPRIVMAQHP